jgi:hypothetical protein
MTPNGNQYARQRDIDRLRDDFARSGERAERETAERFDRAHSFYLTAHGNLATEVAKLGERVDKVESVLDQQRGARNLVYALIGSNILLAVVSLATIGHLVGIL